ncbi:MAG: TIR-like domain-containing protein [Hymenobacter sp.]|jgi:hypothetical protein|nr:MAG: TIR-like domain-containing protein [Hymenobacter sp.]
MPRKVFFSFHYSRDNWRVPQIRNSQAVATHFTRTPFLDKAEWESIKRSSFSAVKKWIDDNMHGTSVVVVCFGYETAQRPWVKYELEKAHLEGRGILAIDMSGMKDRLGNTDWSGINPLTTANDGQGYTLARYPQYRTYSWNNHDGRTNIGHWIEQAALLVGR